MSITDQRSQRTVRSFVLRTGRITMSQKRAFEQHWQRFGLSVDAGHCNAAQVFARQAPLILEIGFGMGESLLNMARQAPENDFIGIEVHTPGVGRLLNNLATAEINNVRIYHHDAIAVLQQCIVDSSLQRVQLFFPDPWPKKKHHKRRIVQTEFLDLVWRKLQPAGIFHLATDWQAYAQHMLDVFALRADKFSNCAGAGHVSPRPDYRPLTKFEQRGRRLGHGVWDLLYEKVAETAGASSHWAR